jgi:RNA polymerase sigma-70 factor, ECF subfamily
MRLPVHQRATVILMDVLGYPLNDITQILQVSLPAVKSSLHRGRANLRALARLADDGRHAPIDATTQLLLRTYVDHFNARNFDAIRDLLAAEARLELVSRLQTRGKAEVSRYFANYASITDWCMRVGTIDGVPAILVFEDRDPYTVAYCVLVDWEGHTVRGIRDFRHARYITDGATFSLT